MTPRLQLRWPELSLQDIAAVQKAMDGREFVAGAVLENSHHGIVLLDCNGMVVLLNRAAKAIVAANDGVSIRDGRLVVARADEETDLVRLMSGAARAPPEANCVLAISRPSARRSYVATALPFPSDGPPGALGAAAVVVFITDPEQPRMLPESSLMRLYRLTGAEASVAVRIVGGRSLKQAADDLGIATTTARLHLQRVLKKTGTNRQSELVRLLLTTLPPGL